MLAEKQYTCRMCLAPADWALSTGYYTWTYIDGACTKHLTAVLQRQLWGEYPEYCELTIHPLEDGWPNG